MCKHTCSSPEHALELLSRWFELHRAQGSNTHPSDFIRCIALVARGHLQPSRIVSDTLPFEPMPDAMQLASTGRAGKIQAAIS